MFRLSLRTVLNVSSNGALLADVKRLKGLFEVLLVVLTHEDTQEVHALLGQLERVMMMYPLERFDKLETHCVLAEKYGFRSDFFA